MSARARVALSCAGAAAWASFIYWESSRANPFPFLPQGLLSHDKLLHAAAYAVLAGLAAVAVAATRLPAWRAIAAAALVATAYGATDEWHQRSVPGRTADPADLAADAVGAMAGAAAGVLRSRRRRLAAPPTAG